MTAIPTPDFITSLASWTWLENTGTGPVAFLLLAHPDPDTVHVPLTQLTQRLGLAPPGQRLPDTGNRVLLPTEERAAVFIDNCPHLIEVEAGQQWTRFVRDGGPVALLLGLAPLTRCAPAEDVETYLGRATLTGRLRLGTARLCRMR